MLRSTESGQQPHLRKEAAPPSIRLGSCDHTTVQGKALTLAHEYTAILQFSPVSNTFLTQSNKICIQLTDMPATFPIDLARADTGQISEALDKGVVTSVDLVKEYRGTSQLDERS